MILLLFCTSPFYLEASVKCRGFLFVMFRSMMKKSCIINHLEK
nr:MAG TPA: hypothetical protein [Caudoviricetes sp.]